ncbi:MAG: MFS transporter [Candidatus Moranbacteria bacterium]|nr:MFS transporter [Candidatus Moranbacteria bacterium]
MISLTEMSKPKDVPKGVRMITLITSIRWMGWGFAESLIPVFLFSFGKTYAEAGLLKSVLDVSLIVSMLFAGLIADSISATAMIAVGLVIYIFIGLGYWMAGVTGLVVFILFARIMNGISYALDSVGREAYISGISLLGGWQRSSGISIQYPIFGGWSRHYRGFS